MRKPYSAVVMDEINILWHLKNTLHHSRVKGSMILGEREWKAVWHFEREKVTMTLVVGERERVKDSVTLRENEKQCNTQGE